ncbi:MAG: hypothetical protein GY925_17790 [Actinomycetia bacterium]|nr:hypothetical protein [Actinomycetes bacterium]
MGITATFTEPLFTGTLAGSSEIGVRFPVALNGKPHMVDTRREGEWRHVSVPLLRSQSDQSVSPGAQSVNPEDLWRSSITSWHRGAGQTWRNKDAGELGEVSSPYQFNASVGVDVWGEGQIGMLNDTESKLASVSVNLDLGVAGGFLYVADGQTLKRTADVSPASPSWTSITTTPAQTIVGVVSTGADIYLAYGSAATAYVSDSAGTTGAALTGSAALNADVLGYAKGRLMAGVGPAVWNITSTSAATLNWTHPDAGWTWVGFADAGDSVFMAGYSGERSEIYRTVAEPDGTSLTVPVAALTSGLADGEVITGVYGYLVGMVIATNKGIRFAIPDANDNLTAGRLIPVLNSQAFEGQDRFTWFGWTNYDGDRTGLGRLDPSTISADGRPAYASDLMAGAQGTVTSAATFEGVTVFSVSGVGVFGETTDLVSQATIDMGLEDYGLVEDKVARAVIARFTGEGTVDAHIRSVTGGFVALGTNTEELTDFAVNSSRASAFEVRLVLNRSATDSTAGPTVDQEILKVYPAVTTTRFIHVPLRIWETDRDLHGNEFPTDVRTAVDNLWGLRNSRAVVQWQEGAQSYSVILEDLEWRPTPPDPSLQGFQGTAYVKMKEL